MLGGRTAGLRPAQRRRLERICHRRHPPAAVADVLALQRLAAESRELELPLTLVIDARGLCRLVWVGPLQAWGQCGEGLPGARRGQGRELRLVTCCGRSRQLEPDRREGVAALDLEPLLWLRYGDRMSAAGQWPALLLQASRQRAEPWQVRELEELAVLCGRDPQGLGGTASSSPQPAARSRRQRGAAPGASRERVLLLALSPADRSLSQRRLGELEGLVRSAGADPVGVVEQRRSQLAPQTIWGQGKLAEAALEARRLGASLVVTDRELTPVQGRNLERLLDLPLSDRSELILDIFAQRAASAAGRLQVELAQLRYRLPRLLGRGRSLSRQGGGIGTRGPGETQLEKDRRAIARRIERLQRQVRELGEHRARLRQARGSLKRLALVGYTNAGKSSLLNAMVRGRDGRQVLAADRLFATLDPTTRRVEVADPGGGGCTALLLTDTVGFIRDLPPSLLEAFRSTLEEALAADGLLLVVDLSDPAWPDQLRTVHAILDGLGSEAPRRLLANQIDRCPAGELERARSFDPEVLFVSATAGLGLHRLSGELRCWPQSAAAAVATDKPRQVNRD